ncbi:MAG: hypothetical protein KIS92_09050 [Planctomycetota bacterium]|nr:hypothetical protein [Planctomycetota bacterium]
MPRIPLTVLLSVVAGAWMARAACEDAPKPDAEAQKELEARLKEAENEPAKPTGKVKKIQKGGDSRYGEGANMYARLLEQFDANQDKKLTGAERTDAIKDISKSLNGKDDLPAQVPDEMAAKIAEMRKHTVERYDENKDGKVDEKEAAKVLEQMEKMNSPEGQELKKRLVERFDENKDGKLDEKEMAKAQELLSKRGERRPLGREGRMEKKNEAEKEESVTDMSDAERAKAKAEIDKILNGN